MDILAAEVSEYPPEEHVTVPIYEYVFVTEPDDYFFCPVNYNMLLQPQQSICCGNHFSPEAVTVFQGNECALCKKKNFTTQPNKYFRDRVRSLDVFCQHKEKGCEWKGKVSELEHHMKTCPLRNTPSKTPREIYNITLRVFFPQFKCNYSYSGRSQFVRDCFLRLCTFNYIMCWLRKTYYLF